MDQVQHNGRATIEAVTEGFAKGQNVSVEIDGERVGGVFLRPGEPGEAITLESRGSKAHTSATLLGSSGTTPGTSNPSSTGSCRPPDPGMVGCPSPTPVRGHGTPQIDARAFLAA